MFFAVEIVDIFSFTADISRLYLVSVAAQTSLYLTWSKLEDRFSRAEAQLYPCLFLVFNTFLFYRAGCIGSLILTLDRTFNLCSLLANFSCCLVEFIISVFAYIIDVIHNFVPLSLSPIFQRREPILGS